MVEYLSVSDVEALHIFIMEKMESQPARLRDRALLEAALMRPQMASHYNNADLIEQAVYLVIGISQAQAFLDGNKRTALIALDVFLRINGLRFVGEPLEIAKHIEAFTLKTASRELATLNFTSWLRENTISE
jgi:death-on-curing protein